MELADARYRDTQSRLITAAVLTGRILKDVMKEGSERKKH